MPHNRSNNRSSRGEANRQALLEAALEEFARHSYYGANNRDIAARANANQALIGYHFGGKEGLYLAVFEQIRERIRARVGPALDSIEQLITDDAVLATEQWLEHLLQLVTSLVRLFADNKMKTSAQLILQEQQDPTEAFDILYQGFMARALATTTQLVQKIRPDLNSQAAALMVAAILGQTLVFRAARSTFLRHLEWQDIGPDELTILEQCVTNNVRNLLHCKDSP